MAETKRQYTIKPGHCFGRGYQYGPGDTVLLTEREASGFLDKLTPIEAPIASRAGMDPNVAMVDELRAWLDTRPAPADVEAALEAEQASKKRQTALSLLEEYLS